MRLLVVAALVHGGAAALMIARTGSLDSYAFRSPDAVEYHQLAQNLAFHGRFSQSGDPPYAPDTWRTPGYPLFLAVVVVLTGGAPAALIATQLGLSVANVLLAYAAARRLISRRAAVIAALLFLLEPYHLLYAFWLLPTTLLITLLLTSWLCWQSAVETRVWGWFVLLGLLCGALLLTWPGTILLPCGVVIGIVLLAGVRRLATAGLFARWAWGALAGFLVPVVLLAGSWMLRNDQVAGHIALSNQSGVVLAYFKAGEVILWRQGRASDRYLELSTDVTRNDTTRSVWTLIDRDLQARFAEADDAARATLTWENLAQGNRSALDPFVVSRALARLGAGYLWESPVASTACLAMRVVENAVFPLSLALQPAAGIRGSRFGHGLRSAPYIALLVLLLWRLTRPGLQLASAYFPLMTCLSLALTVTPQIDPRFRALMVPFLIVVVFLPRRTSVLPWGAAPVEESDEE